MQSSSRASTHAVPLRAAQISVNETSSYKTVMTTIRNELTNLTSLPRSGLMVALALAVYVFANPVSLAQNAGNVYVRKNAGSPAAQADLDALNVAIGKMKALSCDDPTSWYYQGGIHWVPDDGEDGSNLKNGNPLCPGYNGTTA